MLIKRQDRAFASLVESVQPDKVPGADLSNSTDPYIALPRRKPFAWVSRKLAAHIASESGRLPTCSRQPVLGDQIWAWGSWYQCRGPLWSLTAPQLPLSSQDVPTRAVGGISFRQYTHLPVRQHADVGSLDISVNITLGMPRGSLPVCDGRCRPGEPCRMKMGPRYRFFVMWSSAESILSA
jgi:hypothetical protein